MRTKNELRCFCGGHPLLAVYGVDDRGKLYVHVKIFKQDRIFGEVLITDGVVRLHCRNCLRWQQVTIRQPNKPVLVITDDPIEVVSNEASSW